MIGLFEYLDCERKIFKENSINSSVEILIGKAVNFLTDNKKTVFKEIKEVEKFGFEKLDVLKIFNFPNRC